MWPRFISAAFGIWLMAAPSILGFDGPARINCLIIGPIAASIAVTAVSEVMRPLRRLNSLLGLWLLATPLVLAHDTSAAVMNSLIVGAALLAFSLIPGRIHERYGGGWSALWRRAPAS